MVFNQSLFCLAISFSFLFFILQAQDGGFHVYLIHRDSPNSPFYDPSETHSQRLIHAVKRAFNRAISYHNFSFLNTPESTIASNTGEYLMEIAIGTPPVKILGVADTGSDLTWTQCSPCAHCYNQKDPLFNPKASSSLQEVQCESDVCKNFSGSLCAPSAAGNRTCQYSISYGDGSYTEGSLLLDTVTLGSTNGVPMFFSKTAIGCGYNNTGSFERKGSGIIGLGRGPDSIMSKIHNYIGGRFSYCLVSVYAAIHNSSKISFGNLAKVSGPDAVTTPMTVRDTEVFYFLTLEGISVGNERLGLNSNSSSPDVVQQGNMIIDSGTTLTILPKDLYDQIESRMIKAIGNLERVYRADILPLCYRTKSDAFGAPNVTMHFTNADLKLQHINTFLRYSEDLVCFAFVASSNYRSFSILGNLAQMNYLVGYDIDNKTVSFKPADCAKL